MPLGRSKPLAWPGGRNGLRMREEARGGERVAWGIPRKGILARDSPQDAVTQSVRAPSAFGIGEHVQPAGGSL